MFPCYCHRWRELLTTHISLFIPIQSTAPSRSILYSKFSFLLHNLKIMPCSLIRKFPTQLGRCPVASTNWTKWGSMSLRVGLNSSPSPMSLSPVWLPHASKGTVKSSQVRGSFLNSVRANTSPPAILSKFLFPSSSLPSHAGAAPQTISSATLPCSPA